MKKESYEKMRLDITEFETEDIIVTSGETPDPGPGPNTPPAPGPGEYEYIPGL